MLRANLSILEFNVFMNRLRRAYKNDKDSLNGMLYIDFVNNGAPLSIEQERQVNKEFKEIQDAKIAYKEKLDELIMIQDEKSKSAKDYFEYFSQELRNLSDEELVSRFNKGVGISAYGVARQGYLWAIHEEFNNRKIDYSTIGDSKSISFKHIVYLKEKKIFLLNK